MSKTEYGVYSDKEQTWLCPNGYEMFHTDHLGVAIAQRDVALRYWSGSDWRVRLFPQVGNFDFAGNIATMPPRVEEA